MVDAKRIGEEQAARRQIELDRIEKEKDAEHKRRLLLQMKKERCDKLGIPFVEEEALKELKKDKTPPKLSKTESIYIQLEQVRVGNFAYP